MVVFNRGRVSADLSGDPLETHPVLEAMNTGAYVTGEILLQNVCTFPTRHRPIPYHAVNGDDPGSTQT